jgi:hypothetical protein
MYEAAYTKGGLVLWCMPSITTEFIKITNNTIDKAIVQVCLNLFQLKARENRVIQCYTQHVVPETFISTIFEKEQFDSRKSVNFFQ